MIEHIEDDHHFARSIHTSLASGGVLYITVPAYGFLWSDEDVKAGHFRRYSLPEINRLLESAGFQIEYSTYIFSILPLPIFFFRALPSMLGWRRQPSSDQLTNLKQDHNPGKGWINRALNWICRLELSTIRKGRRTPFGGSCLIVARKI